MKVDWKKRHDELKRKHDATMRKLAEEFGFLNFVAYDIERMDFGSAKMRCKIHMPKVAQILGRKYKETLRRFDGRLELGQQTFCRIDLSRVRQQFKGSEIYGVKVEITTDGRGIVQQTAFEREFAMLVMDFCEEYSKRYSELGDPPLVFGPSALLIARELHERTAEADRKKRVMQLNVDRWKCEHRTASGHCSPAKFDCLCYRNGMCVECREAKA